MEPVKTLIIATRNAHKLSEIQAILGTRFRYLTLNDFPKAPKVIEDAPTFAGNASKKAVELACWIGNLAETGGVSDGAWVLADDSGLEVDALNGAPGVYSARFAALETGGQGNSPDAENNARLLRLLKDVPAGRRNARFRCVIALTPVTAGEATGASPVCSAQEGELRTRLFDGACEGRIEFTPRGKNGFGYDPLFVPDGFDLSFAELGEEVKNRISHRSRALERMKDAL